MRLKRIQFIQNAGASIGVAALQRHASAAQFSYKFGHSDPVDYPAHVRLVQMANAIRTETNGRMEIKIFPNSELGSTTSMISQVRLGSIQFTWTNHGIYSSIVPISNISGLGFIFPSEKLALATLDGPLGAYIRKEFLAKGLRVFEKTTASGFHQMTASTRPIRAADDFAGFKVRTPAIPITVDLFRTLGASPTPMDSNEMYTGLQTKVVDGAELPLGVIESYRIYEVQKYISITNHNWAGYWLTANPEAWNALPPDIQVIVDRNAAKAALAVRRDIALRNTSVGDKLTCQGIVFNNADTAGMRARVTPYYAKWKAEFGNTAWSLLEAAVGKLV